MSPNFRRIIVAAALLFGICGCERAVEKDASAPHATAGDVNAQRLIAIEQSQPLLQGRGEGSVPQLEHDSHGSSKREVAGVVGCRRIRLHSCGHAHLRNRGWRRTAPVTNRNRIAKLRA